MTTCLSSSDYATKKFYFICNLVLFIYSFPKTSQTSFTPLRLWRFHWDRSFLNALVDKGTDAPYIWCNIDDDFGKRPSAFHFGSLEELKLSHSEAGVSLQLYYEQLCFVICSQCYGSFTGLYLQVGKYRAIFKQTCCEKYCQIHKLWLWSKAQVFCIKKWNQV